MTPGYADLVAAYLAKGGTITICPPGIGLGYRVLPKTRAVVGGAKPRVAGRRRICARVIDALARAGAPLTLAAIADMTGIAFDRLRGAMTALERDRQVLVTGGGHGRLRFFSLANTGAGLLTGGPASESASGARAELCLTSDARPGRAA